MESEIQFLKGDECYDVSEVISNELSEMLNKEFEDVNAELKSNIKIKMIIENDANSGVTTNG